MTLIERAMASPQQERTATAPGPKLIVPHICPHCGKMLQAREIDTPKPTETRDAA